MPEAYIPERPYFGKDKRYTVAEAAGRGQMIVCRCSRCKRVVRFLAADLVAVKGPTWEAIDPPFGCSKCKTAEYVRVEIRIPAPGDYGSLIIRRPAHVVTTQMWRSVKLGD